MGEPSQLNLEERVPKKFNKLIVYDIMRTKLFSPSLSSHLISKNHPDRGILFNRSVISPCASSEPSSLMYKNSCNSSARNLRICLQISPPTRMFVQFACFTPISLPFCFVCFYIYLFLFTFLNRIIEIETENRADRKEITCS